MADMHFRPNSNGVGPNACGDRSINFVLSIWRHKEVTCHGCRMSTPFRERCKANNIDLGLPQFPK